MFRVKEIENIKRSLREKVDRMLVQSLSDELKKNPEYQDITIVLLTAVGSAVTSTRYTHQDGMSTLADDYIAKPIDLDKLMSMIDEFTGQS